FSDTEPVGTDSISTGALTHGSYSFIAVYNGDSNFQSSTGPIEPLTVEEARILITPQSAVNDVNTPHTLTAEVDVSSDGTNWTPEQGALVTFDFVPPPVGPNPFFVGGINTGTTGPNGQTSVQINSADPGTFTIQASTTFTVGGVTGTFTDITTGTGAP